tara:strand:- start:13210 stop:14598 length:1389 start_codon:yes stop_codon:yes gene_type:complete
MSKLNFNVVGQGSYKKTGPRSGKFYGPKHANNGIKTQIGGNGGMIEVEGGESVGEVNTNQGRQPFIFSEYVKRRGGVSYADEFDSLINSNAPQTQVDALASEQDGKAKRQSSDIQVTPAQRGGAYNNLNNTDMNNKNNRGHYGGVMKYGYGGKMKYNEGGRVYSGEGSDVGPAIQRQRGMRQLQHGVDERKWYQKAFQPLNWLGGQLTRGVKMGTEIMTEQATGKTYGNDQSIGDAYSRGNNWSNETTDYTGTINSEDREAMGYGQRGGVMNSLQPQQMQGIPSDNPAMLGQRIMRHGGAYKYQAGGPMPLDMSSGEGVERSMPQMETQMQEQQGPQGPMPPQGQGIVNKMMGMLKFSGGLGIESLPPEAQDKVKMDFENMSQEEQMQWINFMTNESQQDDGAAKQTMPTRTDKEAELINRIMQDQGGSGYSPTPSGEQQMMDLSQGGNMKKGGFIGRVMKY